MHRNVSDGREIEGDSNIPGSLLSGFVGRIGRVSWTPQMEKGDGPAELRGMIDDRHVLGHTEQTLPMFVPPA